MRRRWKRVYAWMLETHPNTARGMSFVIFYTLHRYLGDDLEKELRSWQYGRCYR